MRVLIAGCGYVGSALARHLVDEGHEVFGLRRRPEGLPAGVRGVAADLRDPASLAAAPAGCDVVVYAASADRRDEAAYRAAYVDGIRHLRARLEVADGPGAPRRWLYVSSTGVYGQSEGEWVDESSPTEPGDFTGRLLLEGEAVASAAAGRVSVVRFGGIYGPGRTGLLQRVARGEATFAPGPPRYTNRIHRDDCAGVLRHLMTVAEPPPVVAGVDADPAPQREVLEWIARRLGAPPPRAAEPGPASRRARANRRVRNRLLLSTGYRFRYPGYREGYGALLDEVRGVPSEGRGV